VDPDGNAWEVFVVIADAEEMTRAVPPPERPCRAPSCCAPAKADDAAGA
jgi:hypothetical protein